MRTPSIPPVPSRRATAWRGRLAGGKVIDRNLPRHRVTATRALAGLVAVLAVLLVVGGGDVEIRIVGRESDSGSQQAFAKYVLHDTEPRASSTNCRERDRVPTDTVIRCERKTTEELLTEVNRVPGAIGYADASDAAAARFDKLQRISFDKLQRISIDGYEPTVDYLDRYPFWTVEYAYTNGVPPTGEALERFTGYLSSDAAARLLREAGYLPCVRADRSIDDLCTKVRQSP